MRISTLCIPDAHHQPGQSVRRDRALNRLVKAYEPDQILIIGDWVDMASLSRFDTLGSKALEGTRIKKDLASGVAGLQALMQDIKGVPVIFTEGNHEERIKRMEEEHPRLMGLASAKEEFGNAVGDNPFTYADYREYVRLGPGLLATHVPHNNMKPIESTSGARKVLALAATSVIYGHTHQLDFATITRNGGSQLYGLNIGCFIEEPADPPYMKGRIKDWWRGVVIVEHHTDRPWDGGFTTVSLNRLIHEFGEKK